MASKSGYQCLSCLLKDTFTSRAASASRTTSSKRLFHVSTPRSARRRPAYPSVKQSRIDAAAAQEADIQARAAQLQPYTQRERELLAMRYTPEQMEIIEAGEAAISSRDMAEQGRLRGDAFRPTYIDDFSTLRPLVDKPARLALDDAEDQAGDKKKKDVKKLKLPGPLSATEGSGGAEPHLQRLSLTTGLPLRTLRSLRIKNLVSHRVVNQTRMGKIQSLYFLTIAGNQDGMVGVGEGKGAEDEDGRRQAMMNAIRNLKPVPRYEGRTIFGEVEGKVGGSVVKLMARPPGFGNRCQHLIFELARAAGISDLAATTPRSRNKMNVVKAAWQALTSQRLPEDVARARGRKMVDVRRVYYGGLVG
ncbi:hypothetical protein BAUCODRAFT_78828 [Baudoinia panamericana UAMH 10762]|uniref:Small ribosomal subunit protein uS5m n=1 Tax=Baudoinia panamericana (strain UAMH 10762) TaxID=717646 RepID=M2M5E5_BAUPA|nr:uncharacterized protein BAUCODRAFT_78828 [Baudoinia panamericana UAMH 10762]EMC91846.1 hypothetical protein BAUCODRAFT_78828 [Baudoinia panamericana UAMH 10762]